MSGALCSVSPVGAGTVDGVAGEWAPRRSRLVKRTPCRPWTRWPSIVSLVEVQYFVVLVNVKPVHEAYFPALMSSSHVDQTGNPDAACKYLTKASTLGRSYALYVTRETRDASWGTSGMSALSGSSAMRYRYGACSSRHLFSIALFVASLTTTASRLKVTVQSALYMGPTPSSMWLKPGII